MRSYLEEKVAVPVYKLRLKAVNKLCGAEHYLRAH
jgi:hypothetical protein